MDNQKIYHGGGVRDGSGFAFNIGGTSDQYLLYKDSTNKVDYGFDWLHVELGPLNDKRWYTVAGAPTYNVMLSSVVGIQMFPNDRIRAVCIIPWRDFTYVQYALLTVVFYVVDVSVPDTKEFSAYLAGVKDTKNWRTPAPIPNPYTLSYSYSGASTDTICRIVQTRVNMAMTATIIQDGPKFCILDIERKDSNSGDPVIMDVSLDFPIKKIKNSLWFSSGTPINPP